MTKDKSQKQGNNSNEDEEQEEMSEIARTSQRFTEKVQDAFNQELASDKEFTDYEKQLARHLFIKINQQLKEFEKKRVKYNNNNKLPYKWSNIDLEQLAMDAVHRINLGLDALIPNHIWPVPYHNSKKGKYDLDLQIGYKGKDYYRRKAAVEEPKDIRYELIYSNQTFKPLKKDKNNEVESYIYEEADNPFNPGEVIGGFGYIIFEDSTKNKLVKVSEKEFRKSKNKSKSGFWDDWPDRMRYKTLVHRTTEKLQIDPEKVNAKSFGYVEQQEVEQLETPEKKNKKAKQGTDNFSDFQEAEEVEPNEEPDRKPDNDEETQEDQPENDNQETDTGKKQRSF